MSRDGYIKFIYSMRICDKVFVEKHTTAMFGLAKRYTVVPKDLKNTRLSYPEFCEALVRVVAGRPHQPYKNVKDTDNLSQHPHILAKEL